MPRKKIESGERTIKERRKIREGLKPKGKEKKRKYQLGFDPVPQGAVKYVYEERKKMGLPLHAQEEILMMEEKIQQENARGCIKNSYAGTFSIYRDIYTMEKKVFTETNANALARGLVEWVDSAEDPVSLTEFLAMKKLLFKDFYSFCEKYPILEEAKEYALMALGVIRERKILNNKWNGQAGMFMMPQYDPQWKQESERRAHLQKESHAPMIDLKAIVAEVLTPAPRTEEVRLKKEQDMKRIENDPE